MLMMKDDRVDDGIGQAPRAQQRPPDLPVMKSEHQRLGLPHGQVPTAGDRDGLGGSFRDDRGQDHLADVVQQPGYASAFTPDRTQQLGQGCGRD